MLCVPRNSTFGSCSSACGKIRETLLTILIHTNSVLQLQWDQRGEGSTSNLLSFQKQKSTYRTNQQPFKAGNLEEKQSQNCILCNCWFGLPQTLQRFGFHQIGAS